MYSTTALIICIIIACFVGMAIGAGAGDSHEERASVGILSVLIVICTIIFAITRLIYMP